MYKFGNGVYKLMKNGLIFPSPSFPALVPSLSPSLSPLELELSAIAVQDMFELSKVLLPQGQAAIDSSSLSVLYSVFVPELPATSQSNLTHTRSDTPHPLSHPSSSSLSTSTLLRFCL